MKIDRVAVYNKYGGKCAYCGRKIDYKDMQVDHIVPQARGGSDDMENLMPSCRLCNHYKRANSLEGFRYAIRKIPKKLARTSYIYRIGMAYGFYDDKDREIEFYFEKCEESEE